MNESQRIVLKRFHQKLADDLVITEELLGELYQAGIFPLGMIELIRAERVPPDRVQRLLELLPKRGPEAFDLFVKVLEDSYPWLATLLASAPQAKPQPAASSSTKADGGHRHQNRAAQARSSSPGLQGLEFVDGDIKKMVQAFVHKQFGHSKRISEKDKKSVERFVSDQIQRERTRYLSMLSSSSPGTPCSDMGSTSDNVFQATEIQDHLFSIHMKLEPHVTDRSGKAATSNNYHQNNNPNNNNNHSTGCTCDGGDTHENCFHSNASSYNHHIVHKLMPEDMDFQLISKEVEEVVRHVELLEAKISDSLALFDPRLHGQPLAALIERILRRCDRLEVEQRSERDRVCDLLDECHKYSDHIEVMEKERAELRKQITAVYQDMGTLRQEKAELKDKLRQMEKDRVQWQAPTDRGRESNFRLGIVSKAAKTTPRGAGTNVNIYGGGAGLRGVAGGAAADEGGAGPVQPNYGIRRNVNRGATLRTPVAYTGYSRRYQGVTSRYAMSGTRKKTPQQPGQKEGSIQPPK
ncbi:casp2 and ripk1 domain containing adaptor with death domain [Plakobranchus ocellatus]|uniref:Casp2 and ripk1 domain containing adaptor with death domain n=1 Tax=Plakobranchus ocellatus TaxID=259542 RepID=A0AAV4AHV0_9GAST|nr:casp2 and ripk1 domain containing adaptor with death domain [Plakobranchus ocellatus]